MAQQFPAPHDGALLVRRSILITTLITAALLLLLLWPVAPALRDALAAFIQARGDLIATALLVIACCWRSAWCGSSSRWAASSTPRQKWLRTSKQFWFLPRRSWAKRSVWVNAWPSTESLGFITRPTPKCARRVQTNTPFVTLTKTD
jgi:hypothetical protein